MKVSEWNGGLQTYSQNK